MNTQEESKREELKKQEERLSNIVNQINGLSNDDKNRISDGYHTFSELYAHRNTLFIALCKSLLVNDEGFYEDKIYKTRFDSENKYCGDGWFLLGINLGKGKQISYHLPIEYWDKCKQFKSFDKAPAFDGHTSEDVLKRLLQIPTI